MRLIKVSLILFIFVLSHTNSHSQAWIQCTDGIYGGTNGVSCIASQDNYMFASPFYNKIYRSSDNGINWFLSNNGLGRVSVYNFYVDGMEIFACTSEGLYSSSNYGQNWNPRGFNTYYTDVGCIIKSGPNLIVGLEYSDNAIYYSTNNGVNWINSTGYNFYAAPRDFISVGSTLFVANYNYGIYASTDNGITWQERNNGLTSRFSKKFSYFNSALYVAGNDISRSFDNGMNWSRCDSGFIGDNRIISLATHNGFLFAGTSFLGVYRSSNGSYWSSARSGIDTSDIESLLSYNSKLYAASELYKTGIYATTNNGQNWYISAFDRYIVNSIVTNTNTIFIGTSVSGIFSSTDNGDTWYPANVDMNNKNILSMIKHDTYIFAGTIDSGIYKSSNNGQNWIKSNYGLNNYSIKSLFTKDSILYCGTKSGIYKTTNFGQIWNFIGLQNVPINTICIYNNNYFTGTYSGIRISSDGGSNWISNLTSDTINSIYSFSERLFAGTNHGIKCSSNNGNTWVSLGLNDYKINSISNMDDTLLASSNIGIFATTNMGITWINLGPRQQQTSCLNIYDNYIFAGGWNSVWRKDANILSSISIISSTVPEKHFLHQNYPNPFNPTTKIKFDIPKTSFVKLAIYDITGREIKIIVDDILQPGIYEMTWSAESFSSGIYFYKLTTQNFTETKKMLLLK